MNRTVSAVYPSKWLKAEDLRGGATTVTVERADVESIRQRDGEKEARIVLSFVGKSKKLIMNKTQAAAAVVALGTELFDDWKGCDLRLSSGTSPNGKPTIVVSSAPAGKAKAAAVYSTRPEDNPFEDA